MNRMRPAGSEGPFSAHALKALKLLPPRSAEAALNELRQATGAKDWEFHDDAKADQVRQMVARSLAGLDAGDTQPASRRLSATHPFFQAGKYGANISSIQGSEVDYRTDGAWGPGSVRFGDVGWMKIFFSATPTDHLIDLRFVMPEGGDLQIDVWANETPPKLYGMATSQTTSPDVQSFPIPVLARSGYTAVTIAGTNWTFVEAVVQKF